MPVLHNLSLLLPGVPLWVKVAVLLLLFLPNLWCIFQAATKNFRYSTEKWLWLAIGVMFPVLGGLFFLLLGRSRVLKAGSGN